MIDKFWNMIISNDEHTQNIGFEMWNEFIQTNPKYKNNIMKAFPKSFVNIYNNVNFHDFLIRDISWKQTKPTSTVVLKVYDYYKEYNDNLEFEIIYKEIVSFSMSINKTEFPIFWSNDIFESCNHNIWKHRILCTDGAYFDITFKDIEIRNV